MPLTLSVLYQNLTLSCKYLLTCRCNLFKIFSGYLNFLYSLLDMKSKKLICQKFVLVFFAMGDSAIPGTIILAIVFWHCFVFSSMIRGVICIIINLIYRLPHELLLRLKNFGNISQTSELGSNTD